MAESLFDSFLRVLNFVGVTEEDAGGFANIAFTGATL